MDLAETGSAGACERRPPIYNAEDYILGLKKFSKLTGLQLYLEPNSPLLETNDKVSANNRRNKNEILEMGNRQFSTITELLTKLKDDLTLSFPSFIREFIGDPNDGVTHLLDALKAIQLAQSNITGSLNQLGSRANHVMFKKALSDEFETLLCLKICAKFEDGALRLVDHHSGLFTVAVCMMSNYSKSRVLSLHLLTRLCDMSGGHKQVSDSLSMLRLRFGEPVRLKFLVGMLNSYNSSAFHISCLKFLNKFLETSKDAREKILIQTELEEAGFDPLPLRKMYNNEHLQEELQRWTNNYVDVNSLVKKLLDAERANRKLREENSLLKEKYRHSEDDRKRSKATLERLRYELNTGCDCTGPTIIEEPSDNSGRDLDLAQVETEECSLVTVLASDGYTCITSPVISNRSITIDSPTSSNSNSSNESHTQVVHCVGTDSGMSSEEDRHHLSSASSSSNDEIKSDKSSYSEHQEEKLVKENKADNEAMLIGTVNMDEEYEVEEEYVYAERNVLQEEATTVEAETITVDKFRQRFCTHNNTMEKSPSQMSSENHESSHPKYKAPPPPPRQRRTSSSSNTFKASLELINHSLDDNSYEIHRPRSVAVEHLNEPNSDVVIVPKRGPRPPARRRPKSTPIRSSEMVFLPDMSEGETSDGDAYNEDEQAMNTMNTNNSNFNTLETMSARSFGFIKPSQKAQDNDLVNRIRRHKSFFNAETSGAPTQHHHNGRKARGSKSRPLALRRAESFHHSRSLGDFDRLTRDESPELHHHSQHQPRSLHPFSKSTERVLHPEDKSRKSKSMEFLKSKLLSRKPSTKQVQPQHNHGPLDPRLFPVKKSSTSGSSGSNAGYDWRQDTPFWNSGGNGKTKPKVPAKPQKLREEPWTHVQGPASMWPGGQPGFAPMFLGRKTGVPGGGSAAYFPSFSVANPKNPGNISRNIVMAPPPGQRPPPQAGQYMAFAAAAAAAAAAAQHAAVNTPVNKQLSENLKDRLEITELSDVEDSVSTPIMIPTPDYRGARPPSERSRRSSSSASSAGQHGKILDIPSGLY